jgi:predicted secreted Zn-dependent protease
LRRLAAALALSLLAGCQAQQPGAVSVELPAAPSPEPLHAPARGPNPCAEPLRDVAQASQLLADRLVAIREPLQAVAYDGWTILGLARRANATLKLYADTIPGLEACPGSSSLAARLGEVATSARRQVEIVLAAGAAAQPAPRQAMVGLVELLPEVVEISEDARTLASRSAIRLSATTVPDGATEPLGKLAPLPTPRATPEIVTTAGIDRDFFGPRVHLSTYEVSGTSPAEISASLNASGPYSSWTDSRADGLTVASATYRFQLVVDEASGTCTLESTGAPTITMRYTVMLPRWTTPPDAEPATVEWWNEVVHRIATHEQQHVAIYREVQRELNDAFRRATCETVEDDLVAVWSEATREQCELDMKEYGDALGLSLADCVSR